MENVSMFDYSAIGEPPEFSDSEKDLSTIRNDENSSNFISHSKKKKKDSQNTSTISKPKKEEKDKEKEKEKEDDSMMFDKPMETPEKPERDTDYSNSIPFKDVVEALSKIERIKGANSKDLKKEVLSSLFKNIIENYKKDLSKLYYFLNIKLGPTYLVPEIQITEDKIEVIVGKILDLNEYVLIQNLKKTGDLGAIAYDIKKTSEEMNKLHNYDEKKNSRILTLSEILNVFEEYALQEENDMQKKVEHKYKMNKNKGRAKLLMDLLERADKDEIKFLIRFLEKNLRLGIPSELIFESISKAISEVLDTLSEKDVHRIIKTSYNQLMDEDMLFKNILDLIEKKANFYELIDLCHVRCGVPFNYMTSQTSTGMRSMLTDMGKKSIVCENSYSGIRCQIHCRDNRIIVFNRATEDITDKYPEIVGYVSIFINKSKEKNKKEIKSFIIDAVFLPYDKKFDKSLNMQDLTFFPRESNQPNLKINYRICIFCFDILYFNGELVLNKSLRDRRKVMTSAFCETMSIRFAKSIELEKNEREEIGGFMNESINMKCGGIIGKVLDEDSEYIPGQKNYGWIKVNKGYYKAELDSLYLVIIGAKYGVGDRARLFSMLCFACLDKDNDVYETLVMSNAGLKERQLDEMFCYLKDHILQYTPSNYKFGKYKPDVCFAPRIIVKVNTFFLCLNQFSPVGYEMVYENMGISLRFPRLFKLRLDIKKDKLTTTEDIIRLYKTQDFQKEKVEEEVNQSDAELEREAEEEKYRDKDEEKSKETKKKRKRDD
jgi:DNA ligase-1